jgi:hypothetical protein
MKAFLFLVAMGFSLSAYCQAFIYQRSTMNSIDMNNTPLKKPSVISNPHYYDPVDLTEYSYDSIRELMELNNPNDADAHPWISADGLRLYYTNAAYQLVMAERTDINSYFGAPTVVPTHDQWGVSYWLSTNELDLYISDSYSIYYAWRDAIDLPFSDPFYVEIDGMGNPNYISAQFLNSAQNKLYLHTYPPDKIMEFTLYGGFYFVYERTLPAPDGYALVGGQLSKDDLTFFMGASYNGGKFKLYQMTRATPLDTFDISTFEEIQGINDTSVWNGLPSMSDSLEWVAFNRAPSGNWEDIDLFLAHNGILTSVFDPAETLIYSYAFPNPASDYVCIAYQASSFGSLVISVYSYEGVMVFEDAINPANGVIKISTTSWNNGFYCYRLTQTTNNKNCCTTGKFVVLH